MRYDNSEINKPVISRSHGCLLGVAVGDALGAPAEFMTLQEIKKRYGKTGISDFRE